MKNLFATLLLILIISTSHSQDGYKFDKMPDNMPGTKPITLQGEIADVVMERAHKFIENEIAVSVLSRPKMWKRDFSSPSAYAASIDPNRKRLMQYIGVDDRSLPLPNYNTGLPDEYPGVSLQKISENNDPEIIAETPSYVVYQVKWNVLQYVNGEGLLLQPKQNIKANIIAIPDADQTPEQLAGLAPGIEKRSQFARHLAENGYRVLVPVLISRATLNTGNQKEQTYREWLYRQSFHMGRHLIGYEVMKVMAAVDWFKKFSGNLKIGVAGYCEGGLIAMFSSAVDPRIDATMVSGYFSPKEKAWNEPIYRSVWGFLNEFGGAEIASMIAPRPLVIEHSKVPDIINKGEIHTPSLAEVDGEFTRIGKLVKSGFQDRQLVKGTGNSAVEFGSKEALEKFTSSLGNKSSISNSETLPADKRTNFNTAERQKRQMREIENHVQWIVRDSDYEREKFYLFKIMPEFANKQWSTKEYHPTFPPERFIEQSKEYRKYFSEEIIGHFENPMLPPNPQTRKIYDSARYTGYQVVLDVYPDLIAYGVLLIPKDVKPGEKRPVVVIQHGRNGIPTRMAESTGAKLAEKGFIVYAPFNLYRGEDQYRWLNRKANTLKKTLFSFIVSQHDQTLQWLKTLPFVDGKRMAFYGISYGGETAMRVPAILEDYCLSICSGDFGDWTRKVTDTHYPTGFMNSIEWEMPYFKMGSTFSYAEMAYLIFPRPFMAERGHDDTVQPDQWVFYEYGKVKNLYDQFNLGERTSMEVFNGGHAMRLEGTLQFLRTHLDWP